MREILFRAKRLRDGQWVYGNLFVDDKSEKAEIVYGYNNYKISWEVDPKTICEYIGIKDKNDLLIFENDIIHVSYTDGMEECNELIEVTYTKHGYSPWSWEYSCDGCDLYCEVLSVEVIGNKFDNPNLLEGGK